MGGEHVSYSDTSGRDTCCVPETQRRKEVRPQGGRWAAFLGSRAEGRKSPTGEKWS